MINWVVVSWFIFFIILLLLAAYFISPLRVILGFTNQALAVFNQGINYAGEKLPPLIDKSEKLLAEAIVPLGNAIIFATDQTVNIANNILELAGKPVAPLGDIAIAVTDGINTVIEATGEMIETALPPIGTAVTAVTGAVNEVVSTTGSAITTGVTAIGSGTIAVADGLNYAVGQLVAPSVMQSITGAVTVLDNVISTVPDVLEVYTSVLIPGINTVFGGIAGAVDAFGNVVGKITSPIVSAINIGADVIHAVQTVIQPVVSALKSGVCFIYNLPIIPHISALSDIC